MRRWGWLLVAALGCAPSPSASDGGSTGEAPDPTRPDADVDTSVDDGMTSSVAPQGTTSTSTTDTGTGPTRSSGDGTAGACEAPPVGCGNVAYRCGDGLDNDDDGLVDLDDPECTGPCDDDEGSFATGLPGDNLVCKVECYFDSNTGQGDDGCVHDLGCDPENPGEFVACPFDGGLNCGNSTHLPRACRAFCEPLVLPGCDCFGCCEFSTPEGPQWRYLDSSRDCTAATFWNCAGCTPLIDQCGVPCDPTGCMWCIGLPPPADCETIDCPFGTPCEDQCDCPDGEYCKLGCCHPIPSG